MTNIYSMLHVQKPDLHNFLNQAGEICCIRRISLISKNQIPSGGGYMLSDISGQNILFICFSPGS